jgi:antitoxin CptB
MTLAEPADTRRRRLRMRSWRRGLRETDLLLGPFADAELDGLAAPLLDAYERLLSENDQDLYQWLSRRVVQPAHYDAIVERIAAYHGLGMS